MVKTNSTMLALGTACPDFELTDPSGGTFKPSDAAGKPLAVAFICNHCPFVKHIKDKLAEIGKTYADKGLAFVAVSANDVANYPEDAPEQMTEQGYTFPYLYDEDQSVAKAFTAACTPDFFLFDADHKLVYRGQFDDSRPGNDAPVTGADLKAAMDAVLSGQPVTDEQKPSIGCNIKWKKGNEPGYFQT